MSQIPILVTGIKFQSLRRNQHARNTRSRSLLRIVAPACRSVSYSHLIYKGGKRCSPSRGRSINLFEGGNGAGGGTGGVHGGLQARRAPAVQLPAGAGVPPGPHLLLLPGHVQRAVRPRRRRAAGPHHRRQRQHRALRVLRRLRRPRRRRPQPARPARDPPPRRPRLPALRRVLPLLQPPQVPGVPRDRRRAPRRRRGPPLGGAGRHHDVLPAARPPGDVHLPVLVPLQPRRRPGRPPPLLLQLPPRGRRRQRQRRHLHRLRRLHARRRRPHPARPPACQGRPRRRHQGRQRRLLLPRHRARRDPRPLRQLEDAARAPRRLGEQLLLHLPVQQRQRPPLHAPHQGPQQRLLLGRADARLRGHRLLPRLRVRQPQEEGARRRRRRRRARHGRLGRRARQPAHLLSTQVARRAHRLQGRPPVRRPVPALLQLRPAGRHVPEPRLLDHRRPRKRLADPQQVRRVLQGGAERRSRRGVASRHAQDVSDGAAGRELGPHDRQLPLARAAGVLGREGRGLLRFLGRRRRRRGGQGR